MVDYHNVTKSKFRPLQTLQGIKATRETLLALLLRMVLDQCATDGDVLDSWGCR